MFLYHFVSFTNDLIHQQKNQILGSRVQCIPGVSGVKLLGSLEKIITYGQMNPGKSLKNVY